MKVLVTGISGFAGHHLADVLRKKGHDVHGTSLTTQKSEKGLNVHKLDLLDKEATQDIVKKVSPDWIIHLAALSAPGKSFDNPQEFLTNNTNAQLNTLEAVRNLGITPRILIVSSGEIYGQVTEDELPLSEDAPIRPTSPYAVSKVTQDYLALQYHLSYHMDIVRARPFNHVGPGQSPDFVVSAFAKQIAQIEKGESGVVKVGNLQAKRDFTDVRDMVKAYVALLEKGKSGEVYNIGRGKSFKIQFVLDTLLNLSDKKIEVKQDPSRMRPSDIPDIICDSAKIYKTTGWETEIPFEQTIEDTLDYWRGIV